ncbi:MAG: LPXTG cell wall anchor domain-containing protein [Clostridiales bacterium]|nr:LPXTG cell wall anchor domain-containing protein [Clostridiales bacterium]MDY6116944.1 LPXTG cell wall anchor domain-containing protein [Anaerovoracaceae bacterium]
MDYIANTGDNSPLTMLLILGAVAILALVIVFLKRKK